MVTVGCICCCTCNSPIPESTGICPKCQKWRHCFINLYWPTKNGGDGKHYQLRVDEHGDRMEYGKAWNLRKEVQAAIRRRTFKPYQYVKAERNPQRCELWFPKWLAAVRAEKSPGTYEAYAATVKNYFQYWYKKDLGSIQKKQIKEWLNGLALRRNSVRAIRNRFHAFLAWVAEETDIIEVMPHFAEIKGNDEKRKYTITLEQQFQAADKLTPIMRNAVLVMMLTGMRASEALVLKRSDIDLEAATVTVRRTWSGRQIRETTKTYEPRVIPLSRMAVEVVKDALADRVGDVWLFPRTDGRLPYKHDVIDRQWRKKTGLSCTLRDATRRSYATILKDAGFGMRDIQELLGHKQLATTELYLGKDTTRLRDRIDEIQGKVVSLKNRDETVTTFAGQNPNHSNTNDLE